MRARLLILLPVALSAFSCPARADRTKSVFYVDGLAVDALEEPGEDELVIQPFSLDVTRPDPKRRTKKAAAAPGPGLSLPAPAAAGHLRNAQQYLDDREWELAKAEFLKAIAAGGNAARIAGRAALRFSQLGQIAMAEPFYREFAKHVANDPNMTAGWAATLIRLGRITEAERVLAGVGGKDEGNLMVRFHRAMLDVLNDRPVSSADYWRGLVMRQTETVAHWLHIDKDSVEKVMGEAGYRAFSDIVLGTGSYDHLGPITEAFGSVRDHLRDEDLAAALGALNALRGMEKKIQPIWI